ACASASRGSPNVSPRADETPGEFVAACGAERRGTPAIDANNGQGARDGRIKEGERDMEGVNRVFLAGNLGADPELRYTQGGQPVLNMRLATTESWFDKASNQRKEKTEWHNVSVWAARAEGLAKILKKGDRLIVEGRLQTTSYE